MQTRSSSETALKMAIAVFMAVFLSFAAHHAHAKDKGAQGPELVVYTYDSFVGKEGLGPILQAAYEKKTGEKLRFVTVGDAGQLLARIQLDSERRKNKAFMEGANVVLGIDQNLEPKLKDYLVPIDRAREGAFMKFVDREWWLGEAFVPFDYGVFAFIADTKKLPPADFPKKWTDLLKWKYRKSLLLEDPRTSSPGMAFLLGSLAVTGDGFKDYWKDLRSQWKVLAPGWTQAYSLFIREEAPLVWSYVTSEAYHRTTCKKDNCSTPDRYHAVIFQEGHPVQIEGAAILKDAPGGAKMRKRSLEFLELLTSEQIQTEIPEHQWMMPVRLGIKLPPIFQSLPVVAKKFPPEMDAEKLDSALSLWNQAIR
ncbi:MAG: thiamine ABC transporter substrate-binding protein [Cryobacterium sp.]|nr:thiamine ABC transporter substrate-binding protein [Oligoflexia bacterium]